MVVSPHVFRALNTLLNVPDPSSPTISYPRVFKSSASRRQVESTASNSGFREEEGDAAGKAEGAGVTIGSIRSVFSPSNRALSSRLRGGGRERDNKQIEEKGVPFDYL